MPKPSRSRAELGRLETTGEAESGLGTLEESAGREGVSLSVPFLMIEFNCISDPETFGRFEPDWQGVALGLRFAVAGGPRIFRPADLMMTSSTDAGTSTIVVLMSSCGLVSNEGEGRIFIADGPSGVTGDDSKGESPGEWE